MAPMNGLNALGAKDRGRLVDVDHRNLISLTGSPKLTEKDGAIDSQTDIDQVIIKFNFKCFFFRLLLSCRIIHLTQQNSTFLKQANILSTKSDAKLLPPPSPPAILLSNVEASETGKSMNAPLLPTPRFQSSPLHKQKIGAGI